MNVSCLQRWSRLLGPAVLLVLACNDTSGSDGGSTGSSAASTTTGDGSGTGGGDGSGTSPTTGSQDTGTTGGGCEARPLADVGDNVAGFVIDGDPDYEGAGYSVSAAGDVNGDGLADLVVGAHGYSSDRAYVVLGKTDTDAVSLAEVAAGTGGFVLRCESAEDGCGSSVSGLGDINDDGLADVIVGAYRAAPNGSDSGRTYVVFGKANTDPVSLADVAAGTGGFALDGEGADDRSGESVSGAGDVNGDGIVDILVGAPGASPSGAGSGRTYVVFGKTDTNAVVLADVAAGTGGFVLDGESGGDRAGRSVSAAGDVNGDGAADVVVGAPAVAPSGMTDTGRTYVVFGKAGTNAVALADVAQGIGGFSVHGETAYNSSGYSVSGGIDVNGDGLSDVIVGAPGAAGDSQYSGRAYVVFGKEDTDSIALDDVVQGTGGFALDGAAQLDATGASVSGLGDINGDGDPDIAIGAPNAGPNGIDMSGRTYVVFGKAATGSVSLEDVAQGAGGVALDGEAEDDRSGWSVSGAGDVNGDGHEDLIVGAREADPTGFNSGRTYVIFGGDLCEGG